MTDSLPKPSHKEWRKEAKKVRRKRIRQKLAELRKAQEKKINSSASYQIEIEKARLIEEFELEKEQKESEERNLKWLQEEERAQRQFREEQRLKTLALEAKEKELEKIRQEWEKEQKKIREQKEKLEKIKQEEEKRKAEILERISNFMDKGGEVPEELRVVTETNPGKEVCLFYSKVGVCRFGSHCSRNHQYYKISNILMFTNFYSHFTLDQNKSSEYDTDISLEYDDSEMYSHFRDFYNDIVPEFRKFGEVVMVKVCCNREPHLRGNVFVEFENEREALVAYKSFQGRWYGGKQLNVEFIKLQDWGSAVCGDFIRKRCPKGSSCNFLHVFKNPKNEYPIDWNKNKTGNSFREINNGDSYDRSRSRSWRWSETPEPCSKRYSDSSSEGSSKKRGRSQSEREKRDRKKTRHRDPERSRSRERKRKRSRSRHRRSSRSTSPRKKH